MNETTHDANGGRIDLRLGDERILQLLQKMDYNMTEKFTPLFDNIPLRSKMYLSRTNAAEAEQIDINDTKRILELCQPGDTRTNRTIVEFASYAPKAKKLVA